MTLTRRSSSTGSRRAIAVGAICFALGALTLVRADTIPSGRINGIADANDASLTVGVTGARELSTSDATTHAALQTLAQSTSQLSAQLGKESFDGAGNLKVVVANAPATQAVSGTVNIGNLPATQAVSGTVTVDTSTPLRITNVGSAAETPVMLSGSVVGDDGNLGGDGVIYTVPAGQRLVIESITGWTPQPIGQSIGRVQIYGFSSAGAGQIAYLTPSKVGTDPNTQLDNYSFTAPVRAYADEGTILHLQFDRGGATHSFVSWTLAGYLVKK